MLNLHLNIQPQTENRLKKIWEGITDEETFARNFIDYQIAELKKGIFNIRLDLKRFEETYGIGTKEFYRQFEVGERDEQDDYIIWAGLYEMLCENERQLKELL